MYQRKAPRNKPAAPYFIVVEHNMKLEEVPLVRSRRIRKLNPQRRQNLALYSSAEERLRSELTSFR